MGSNLAMLQRELFGEISLKERDAARSTFRNLFSVSLRLLGSEGLINAVAGACAPERRAWTGPRARRIAVGAGLATVMLTTLAGHVRHYRDLPIVIMSHLVLTRRVLSKQYFLTAS